MSEPPITAPRHNSVPSSFFRRLAKDLAVLNGRNLIDTALMAAALEIGGQKDVNQFAGKAGADDARAHAQHVGVVMQACVLGREIIGAAGGANTLDLVGGHGDADARAAAQNAERSYAGGDFEAGLLREPTTSRVLVIHAFSSAICFCLPSNDGMYMSESLLIVFELVG